MQNFSGATLTGLMLLSVILSFGQKNPVTPAKSEGPDSLKNLSLAGLSFAVSARRLPVEELLI